MSKIKKSFLQLTYLLTAVLSIALLSGCQLPLSKTKEQAQISVNNVIDCYQLQDILKHTDKSSLVVFDIDCTLIAPENLRDDSNLVQEYENR